MSISNGRPAARVSAIGRGAGALLSLAIVSGCAAFAPTDAGDLLYSRAQSPDRTQTLSELLALPQPAGVITAAVYSFRDLTGQYKPAPSNNLSTAVTQGADAILLKALLDSGWFAPVERSSLQHLLTERKIVQSSALETGSENAPPALPPVMPAQILFEGSIVSYDTNIHSGGSGLRFLGVGGSQTYREDRVVVNLRVINIENGAVIHSINSAKRLFSRTIDSGIFAYVDADEILEAEAGFGVNEPSHVAISEAIESALIHVIAEGIVKNSWQLANPAGIENPAFDRFLPEGLRDRFLALKREQAAALAERRRVDESVRQRMQSGLQGLERHRLRQERRLLSTLGRHENTGAADAEQRTAGQDAVRRVTDPASAPDASGHQDVSARAQLLLRARAKSQAATDPAERQAALRAQRLLLEKQEEQARVAAPDSGEPLDTARSRDTYRPTGPTGYPDAGASGTDAATTRRPTTRDLSGQRERTDSGAEATDVDAR